MDNLQNTLNISYVWSKPLLSEYAVLKKKKKRNEMWMLIQKEKKGTALKYSEPTTKS
jgi:hypothetical protein